jgi:hypothetical protein
MKYKYSVLLIFLFCSFAESNSNIAIQYPTQIGIAAGITTGAGISIKRWLNSNYGIQIAGLLLLSEDKYIGGIIGKRKIQDISLGFSLSKNIKEWKFIRLLGYGGISYLERYSIDDEKIVINNKEYDYYLDNSYADIVTTGSGFGFDLKLWHFIINLMGGIAFSYTFQVNKISIGPAFEFGIFYCF